MNKNYLGKLGKRHLSSLIISSLVIVGFVLISIVGIRFFLNENIRGQLALDNIDESANLLYKSLLEQETGQRGYTLTNDESFLEPYENGTEVFSESSNYLLGKVSVYPELATEIEEIVAKGQYWHDHFGEVLVALARQGQAPDVEMLREAKKSLDDFRITAAEFSEHIVEHRKIVRERMQKRINGTLISMMILVTAVISINLWVNIRVLRSVIRPLIELSNCVKSYARHDFSKRIPVYSEDDELSKLIENVDVMRSELANSINTLVSKVNYDELTGLYNRRFFNEFLLKAWEESRKNSEPISLLLMDIDHYKNFNDTYGHLAGDECLRIIAEYLKPFNQDTGKFVARYGGEEFGILLLQKTEEEAYMMAEDIRKRILELKIPHSSSPTSNYVTASLGVATVDPRKIMLPNYLISIADKALYQSKQKGRNRITQFKG